jgi:hypothetical protein
VTGWRLLREMCGDIVQLRKGDHSAERLQIERERLELEKEKTEKLLKQWETKHQYGAKDSSKLCHCDLMQRWRAASSC